MSTEKLNTQGSVANQPGTTNVKAKTHIRQLSYIRVLGLFLVLTYHFWPEFLPGGFFGVDVFFVFSGYLITALAVQEVRKRGKFDLGKFTERRFFRIFPTVAFAMLTMAPLVIMAPETIKYQLKEQVFAGLSFITNFYEISTGTSYANNFAPHIWLHLWSLALEVQFYIVWGLLIWLMYKLVRGQIDRLTKLVALVSLVLLVASASFMIWGVKTDISLSTLYYSLFTHVFPFFFGALLATIAGIHETKFVTTLSEAVAKPAFAMTAIVAGLCLISMGFTFHFDDKVTYYYGFIMASLATVLLILALRLLHTKTDKPEPKVVIFLANISYGVYIFHWPLLTIFRAEKFANTTAVILTIILSIGLAAFMFYALDPILQGKRPFKNQATKVGTLFVTLVLLVIAVSGLSQSTNQTALEKSLWEANNAQTSTILNTVNTKLTQPQATNAADNHPAVIIGDSVTVHTSEALAKKYPNMVIDALSSRRVDDSLLPELEKQVPKLEGKGTIVIALGINSVFPDEDKKDLQKAVDKYGKTHKIIFVTPGTVDINTQTPQSKQVAAFEKQLAKKYDHVYVADWQGALQGHTDWVGDDGIHPSGFPKGISGWMHTLEKAIDESEDED